MSFANKARGATATRDTLLVVKEPSAPCMTSWIAGWEGCGQWGVRGAMVVSLVVCGTEGGLRASVYVSGICATRSMMHGVSHKAARGSPRVPSLTFTPSIGKKNLLFSDSADGLGAH